MPLISQINVYNRKAQNALAVRLRTPFQDLPRHIGESYGAIMGYLMESGLAPADIPYVAYYNQDMNDLDVEIGFPIADKLPEKGGIKCVTIPEGKYASGMYLGAYSDMEPAYGRMHDWVTQNGFEPAGAAYEFYYNGPGDVEDEQMLLTKIEFILK